MLMADDGSNYWQANELPGAGNDWEDLYIDLDSFWDMMEESADPSQNKLEDSSSNNVPQSETSYAVGDNNHLQFDSLSNQLMGRSAMDNGTFFYSSGSTFQTLEVPEIDDAFAMDVDISSQSASQTYPSYCENSDKLCGTDFQDSIMPHCSSTVDSFYPGSWKQLIPNFEFQHLSNGAEIMCNIKDEGEDFPTQFEFFNTRITGEPKVEATAQAISEESLIGNFNVKGSNISCEGGDHIFLPTGKCSDKVNGSISFHTKLEKPLPLTLSNIVCEKQAIYVKDGGGDELLGGISADRRFTQTPSGTLSISSQNHAVHMKEERDKLAMGSHFSKITHQEVQGNELAFRYQVDDDSDICILEDLSDPARCNLSLVNEKSVVSSQHAIFSDPVNHRGVGGTRLKSNERFIFNVALQDLSQPKSEAVPPDGLLAVPLLRHQRIALSWMVQKETASFNCSGGILADDQGLGKTISTIALILKERSPSSSVPMMDSKQSHMETLNLDEDDDGSNFVEVNKENDSYQVDRSSINVSSIPQGKGRPAAGTLIVCPTSVLRQWSEELHNKVTSKANLSVLVYHGSNRTKNPFELAKYDVVVTTYSIVSMEVPKQPLVDDDCDETGKQGNVEPMGISSSKKRKYPPSSGERCLKGKKGVDGTLVEAVARPLARVGWFRVVLDEAQSIKNHRTQVARACWGLRAKRRWCLSGTPIQNAVDDLYSYFRFLRYDPYAAYTSFCASIKVPIQRNPTNGYKRLQAVLKTIMLRRTKGTLLDGEPIINLPPKSVQLKKVDFTQQERDFYCRLEADSRAQFAEYAAAGTVKQNYVNILLMLLRLRQACDHPLLVSGYNSNSKWRPSVDMAKKLPGEKLVCLLNCLETSLAICGLCSDPPEDAVVASCGHAFCNQCICEHLTGDDNQCPMSNCKAQLSVSTVFSRATLRSALSDQPGLENTASGSGSELAERFDSCSSDSSYDSSKIKAALEVLQSLSRPQDCMLRTTEEGAGSSPDSSNFSSGRFHCDADDGRNLNLKKTSNYLVNVVGEKAIVFSQWTRMLDLLEVCLKTTSIKYRRLDGTMSVIARDKAVKDFNTLPEVSVMIMSLKAASLGLNMVAACHVLLLDLWWNPTTEDQAIDRAHRIGQTRPVTVLRLTVKDTVEDRILALQQKKREMVASAFGEDETGGRQTRLTVDDLEYLFNV